MNDALGIMVVVHGGLKGQLKKYNEIKLALQAAIYMTPTTQGVALGYYKLAFQARRHN